MSAWPSSLFFRPWIQHVCQIIYKTCTDGSFPYLANYRTISLIPDGKICHLRSTETIKTRINHRLCPSLSSFLFWFITWWDQKTYKDHVFNPPFISGTAFLFVLMCRRLISFFIVCFVVTWFGFNINEKAPSCNKFSKTDRYILLFHNVGNDIELMLLV